MYSEVVQIANRSLRLSVLMDARSCIGLRRRHFVPFHEYRRVGLTSKFAATFQKKFANHHREGHVRAQVKST